MSQNFEDDYFDVLRAIELAIHNTYQQQPSLVDFQVEKVLDGLVRFYEAERKGKSSPKLRFKGVEVPLRQNVQAACNLHLGRDKEVPLGAEAVSVDEIIQCLKRIRRSVDQMGGRGRQGYLEFLHTFFSEQSS